jgi:hypothetical protein
MLNAQAPTVERKAWGSVSRPYPSKVNVRPQRLCHHMDTYMPVLGFSADHDFSFRFYFNISDKINALIYSKYKILR